MTIKTLTVSKVSLSGGGVVLATTALTASDTGFNFPNDGNTILAIKNGSASSITATPNAQSKYQGITLTNPAFTIAAGATKYLPKLDPAIFNDSNGNVQVDIATAAVTVEAQALNVG